MRIALIINPHAGGKKGAKLLPVIEKKLSRAGVEYHTYLSLYHEHTVKIASELDIARYDAIVAVGGDGTNFHVLNGLLSRFKPETLPPLAILPIGSGNSFARDLNIFSLDDGLRAIFENKPGWIDVCSFSQAEKKYYFVNIAGFGFVTDVAETARKFKWLGDFSYIVGVFHRTLDLHFHHMELELDGRAVSGENCFVVFCNSRFTGGNMLMAPEARIDDGLMDIIIAGKLSRASLLSTLPKIYTGSHLCHPAVSHVQAKTVKIKTRPEKAMLADGEVLGTTPATITVHPRMIRYLA
ncbi:MAG: diacylglycerol kinase family lipid kinase [Desulfobacula sp.]|nr:diacylglycerol kinase family lipid kinase [Desulfobacula sp.]